MEAPPNTCWNSSLHAPPAQAGVFLASLAGSTFLMRATIGDICSYPGGTDFILGLLEECRSIAANEGYPMREAQLNRTRNMLTATGATLTASMLRDVERAW